MEQANAQKPNKITPMMRQYLEHKERHPTAILLFRMGDFYEMFYDDAEKAARILDIALTSRDKNKDESVPMCGFPHHAASAYISKLLAAGERVAVCDQMEDPRKAKGIVQRAVTRVLSPGLTDEPGSVKDGENTYTTAIAYRSGAFGLASFDLSTGELRVTETADTDSARQELRRLNPKEVLVSEKSSETDPVREIIDASRYIHAVDDWLTDPRACLDTLREQYQVHSVEGFGLESESVMTVAAGMMIGHVRETRLEALSHIKTPRVYHLGNFMVLDEACARNLELFRNIKDGGSHGTLVKLLDRTCTAMGARMLRSWIAYPLMDTEEIKRRSDAVEDLSRRTIVRDDVRDILKDIGDPERIAGRISLGSASPRDLVQLRTSIERIPAIVELLKQTEAPMLAEIAGMDDLTYVAHAVAEVIVDTPPVGIKDGGVIRSGYNEELDELRSISTRGKEWIAGIEAGERERTGIPNLKVGYNRVFGYYIEITKAHQAKVPADYVRKQTLVNAERYITEELKEYELKVLNAQERIEELEEEIFRTLRTKLAEVIPRIQQTARELASLDSLASLAEVAVLRGYTKPTVHEGDELVIREGRHPVVETFEQKEAFVPNDVTMDKESDRILIITGPNMAGKSTYMRQIALITLMAQMGSFVPAREASIGLVDRIFTRIGAADYLSFGQSTFMVEMNETAEILNNATHRSLVLLDEVGRGTSTFDGLSIAWAVTEYLHDRPDGGPRTLFATHYHELVELGGIKERVRVYNVRVKEFQDRIVFLRTIRPGGSSRSYGIQVARLAGIPRSVTDRAQEVLAILEKEHIRPASISEQASSAKRAVEPEKTPYQTSLFGGPGEDLLRELDSVDVDRMTPLEALNRIAEWKSRLS